MIFTSKVPNNVKPKTDLVTYLSDRFTYFSRDEWAEKIHDGAIAVDGIAGNANVDVKSGNIVTYDAGEFEEPEADLNYSIIYEDEWFLGINKPGNLLVHRAGKSFRNNLIYQLRSVHIPPFPDAHPTHRLDRDTSGVVIVAKTSESCSEMGAQFAGQEIEKEYVAIVKGIPDRTITEVNLPIGKSTDSIISYKFQVTPDGKEAITRISACEPVGHSHALLTLQPLTGRTHQIRVHCSAIGHPIVGDKLYGMDESSYIQWRDNPSLHNESLEFPRHALHCKSVGFIHPYTKKKCVITAPIPNDMIALMKTQST